MSINAKVNPLSVRRPQALGAGPELDDSFPTQDPEPDTSVSDRFVNLGLDDSFPDQDPEPDTSVNERFVDLELDDSFPAQDPETPDTSVSDQFAGLELDDGFRLIGPERPWWMKVLAPASPYRPASGPHMNIKLESAASYVDLLRPVFEASADSGLDPEALSRIQSLRQSSQRKYRELWKCLAQRLYERRSTVFSLLGKAGLREGMLVKICSPYSPDVLTAIVVGPDPDGREGFVQLKTSEPFKGANTQFATSAFDHERKLSIFTAPVSAISSLDCESASVMQQPALTSRQLRGLDPVWFGAPHRPKAEAVVVSARGSTRSVRLIEDYTAETMGAQVVTDASMVWPAPDSVPGELVWPWSMREGMDLPAHRYLEQHMMAVDDERNPVGAVYVLPDQVDVVGPMLISLKRAVLPLFEAFELTTPGGLIEGMARSIWPPRYTGGRVHGGSGACGYGPAFETIGEMRQFFDLAHTGGYCMHTGQIFINVVNKKAGQPAPGGGVQGEYIHPNLLMHTLIHEACHLRFFGHDKDSFYRLYCAMRRVAEATGILDRDGPALEDYGFDPLHVCLSYGGRPHLDPNISIDDAIALATAAGGLTYWNEMPTDTGDPVADESAAAFNAAVDLAIRRVRAISERDSVDRFEMLELDDRGRDATPDDDDSRLDESVTAAIMGED